MGSFVEGTQSMPFGKDRVRRCMGMWLATVYTIYGVPRGNATLLGMNAPANSVAVLVWANATC